MYYLNKDSARSLPASTARFCFVVYLIYILVWIGGPPFTDRISEVSEITSSNLINQIVIVSLFLLASISLYPLRSELISLLKKEKFLLAFLSWCLISIIWSDFRFISVKRYFQVIAGVIICCAYLLHTDSSAQVIKDLKAIIFVYIILTVLSIILIPAATDPVFKSWRGLASHKNMLGQISLMSLLIWFYAFRNEKGKDKLAALAMSLTSFVLLLGSKSSTPLATLAVLASLGLVLAVDNRTKTLGVGRFFSVLTFLTAVGIIIAIMSTDPGILTSLPVLFGKDSSFSGRVDIWAYIYNETQRHFLLGSGYGSFWIVENTRLLELYETVYTIIFQSHLGYLDLLNEVGIVGLILFFLMIFKYFSNLSKAGWNHLSLWFIVGTLVINLQESTLFRPNTLTGLLFVFFYLELQLEIQGKAGTYFNTELNQSAAMTPANY